MSKKLLIIMFVVAFGISCEGKRGESGPVGPSGIDELTSDLGKRCLEAQNVGKDLCKDLVGF